ncbi:MAG TPA: PilX N-terminal domain-containing pilus assembly protein [bacterium]|nr:PilX N-terminal domain-containing pilus assembly protein [bacterium]
MSRERTPESQPLPRITGARPRSGRGDEAGFALVVLLLVTLFVALVGVAMMNGTVSELQIATTDSNAVQARYLAEAGLAAAANQLSANNAWTGPITQTLGGGSYTVQVDAAASQAGALGAVKSIVSTGSVANTPAGAGQTIRETFLVLPQAFSKPAFSNTTVSTAAAAGITPTIQNTVLRQLGAIHGNNALSAATSVTVAAGTEGVGQITAGSGTISAAGTCIACAPATNQAQIPFPSFNFAQYSTMASANTSPCPLVQANTLFTSQGNFDACISAVTPDLSGFRTITGVWFMNAKKGLVLPNVASEQNLRLNGTLVVYDSSQGNCRATTPCGDLQLGTVVGQNQITITAQNGEPAIMVGGSISLAGATAPGTITVNGLVYILAGTTNPVSAAPSNPGYQATGAAGAPVTINGMVVGQLIGTFDSSLLNYDPSSFFAGLPSGLTTPLTPPFVLLPISWTSGR